MSIVVRDYRPETDFAQISHVWSVVFRAGEPPTTDVDELLDPGESAYVAEQDGQIVGGYQVLDFNTARGKCDVPTGGVAAVGVLPEFRHCGIGKEMMLWSLGDMKRKGFVAASLYPFRASYYRQFGYETVGKRWQITCPQTRMPRIKTTLPVSQVTPDQVLLLAPVYDSFIRKMSGSPTRNEAQWKGRLGKKPPMIYAVGDPFEAYAWTGMEGMFWEDLRIGEFAWSTPEGYRNMLALLSGLAINRSALIWHEPSNSPFLAAYSDQGVAASIDRQIMFRLLDVPGALRCLKPVSDGEFSILVNDELSPENRGPWQVKFENGSVHVAPTNDHQIAMDIRHLSQAFFGEPSFSDLVVNGMVDVNNSVAAEHAGRLLSPIPVCCMDFF